MMSRLWLLVASLSACAGATPPSAQVPPSAPDALTQVEGFHREETELEVSLADGSKVRLDALITRPEAPGRLPLVLLNHGTPRDPAARKTMAPTGLSSQSMAFARRGYGVAVVMRRGYGRTGGAYAEDTGRCGEKHYSDAARAAADDVLGALRRLQEESWVDPERVLVVGVSSGGFASLAAAAANPHGVLGVVSFAGGRGSDRPDHVCDPDSLVSTMGEFGERVRVPSLWVYAPNDHFFDPQMAKRMSDAYGRAGGNVELVISDAYGDDGHMLFSEGGVNNWWPPIAPFLGKLGLPTTIERARVPPPIPSPPAWSRPRRVAFEEYLASESYEKAFAIGDRAWGWVGGKRSRTEASTLALERCAKHGEACQVYAVGDERAR